ncbi:MAG: uncharacterized protein KVP18_001955 [Porospora cf. gigantea A]|uniref:uncharacterized protein n=1 Tax=Porospora cf. gigantea A TaxID=2853593 RepID=UPI00355A3C60|nr:MAG: hypothetical protein KVP18_001955 [Porospora cf. gigantea A]
MMPLILSKMRVEPVVRLQTWWRSIRCEDERVKRQMVLYVSTCRRQAASRIQAWWRGLRWRRLLQRSLKGYFLIALPVCQHIKRALTAETFTEYRATLGGSPAIKHNAAVVRSLLPSCSACKVLRVRDCRLTVYRDDDTSASEEMTYCDWLGAFTAWLPCAPSRFSFEVAGEFQSAGLFREEGFVNILE